MVFHGSICNHSSNLMTIFQGSTGFLQSQSPELLTELKSAVTNVLSWFFSDKAKQLFLIKTSPKFVERYSESLLHNMKLVDKFTANISTIQEARKEHQRYIASQQPVLENFIVKTKHLQKQLEAEFSKLLGGRQFHIIGEINSL
eukprot:Sdes_comp20029_c0_seq1m12787